MTTAIVIIIIMSDWENGEPKKKMMTIITVNGKPGVE